MFVGLAFRHPAPPNCTDVTEGARLTWVRLLFLQLCSKGHSKSVLKPRSSNMDWLGALKNIASSLGQTDEDRDVMYLMEES